MKEILRNDFVSRITKKAKNKGGLVAVEWEITRQCNFSCQHCALPDVSRTPASLNLNQIEAIIKQLKELGCLYIVLTGGEPFAHKDILSILQLIRKHGFCLTVMTNAALLTEDIARELIKFNVPVKLFVGACSLSEEVYYKITSRENVLPYMLKGLDILSAYNLPVSINMFLTQDNFSEIDSMRSFAKEKGFSFRYDYIVQPRLDGHDDVLQYQIPCSDIKTIIDSEKDDYLPLNTSSDMCSDSEKHKSLFRCDAGKSSMGIDADGNACVCLDLPFPKFNILEQGLVQCWNKIAQFVRESKPDENYECARCDLIDICGWCPAMGLRYENNMSSCVKIYKELAQMQKEAVSDKE